MFIPEFFKYGSVLSIPLFSIISLLLVKKTEKFSFTKHTISKSILFLNKPTYMLMFRLNFIVKSLLDFVFILFVIKQFNVSFLSPLTFYMFLSNILFCLLAYFIEGKYSTLHKIFVYGSGIFWSLSMFYLAQLTNNLIFIKITNVLSLTVLVLAFGFMFAKKTNVLVQFLCMLIWYIWIILFVFKYL